MAARIALRAMWRHLTWVLILLAQVTGTARSEAEIDGDPRLFEVVLSAQKANIGRFPKGAIEAVCRWSYNRSSVPNMELHVRQCWQDPFSFWEYEWYHPEYAEKLEREEGKKLAPTFARMLDDGKRLLVYCPSQDVPAGSMKILPKSDMRDLMRHSEALDQRPAVYWARCEGRRPWSEFMFPNPTFNGNPQIEKWVVRQTGDKVIIERHDRPSERRPDISPGGVARCVASMALSGHIIESSYGTMSSRKQRWKKDEEGRVFLSEIRSTTIRPNGQLDFALDVVSFNPNPQFSPEQFTPKALKLKWGAQVEDEIAKKKYTYRDDAVTQEGLDKLSKKLKPKTQPK